MDRIVVPRIPVRARVGVTEEERREEQDLLIDIGLYLDLGAAGRSDDLSNGVDYDAACDAVERAVAARSFHLIEAVAEAVADAIMGGFTVTEVDVRVEKPGALSHRGVPFAAVEIHRRRDA